MCGKSGGERIVHKPALRVCDMGGGSMTSGKVPAKAFAVFAVALMMLSVLPMINVSAPEAEGYVGDTTTVTYHYGESSDVKAVVTYYGTPIAEYNPQYWNDSFAGEVNTGLSTLDSKKWKPEKGTTEYTVHLTIGWSGSSFTAGNCVIGFDDWNIVTIDENHSELRFDDTNLIIDRDWLNTFSRESDINITFNQEVNRVFAGWSKNSEGTNVDYLPGDSIIGESNLYAVWTYPDLFVDSTVDVGKNNAYTVAKPKEYINYNDRNNYNIAESESTSSNSMFTREYRVEGNVTPTSLVTGTYRSETGGGVLDLSRNPTLNGDVVIDTVTLKGHAGTTTQVNTGLYAQGNTLIIGTGVKSSSDGCVEVYGAARDGNQNYSKTDVRIFSGQYSNVVGGGGGPDNDGYTGTITETNLVLVGSTEVYEQVMGGSTGLYNNVEVQVNTTNVTISGNVHVDKRAYADGHLPDGFSTVIGGSRMGVVSGETHVNVSGNAQIFAIQGGGREATSRVDSTNVEISGKANVVFVCGSVTDGRPNNSYEEETDWLERPISVKDYTGVPVKTSNIKIKDSATVDDVYGGGFDIYRDPKYPSTSSTNITVLDNPTIGNLYGGGFRGSIGNNSAGEGSEYVAVSIIIEGGNIGNVFGGGRGGADPLKAQDGEVSQYGYAQVYGDIEINVVGGIIGNLYGGGNGIAGSGHTHCATVVGDVRIVFGSLVQNSDEIITSKLDTKVEDSVYGGGRYGSVGYYETDSSQFCNGLGSYKSGEIRIELNDKDLTIDGSVYGGGLGEESRLATYVQDRVVIINGADIGGSVYGGSRYGDDNIPSNTNLVNGASAVYFVSGDLLYGSSGNIYGAGYRGHSNMDSNIYVGTEAVSETNRTPLSDELKVNSVFGGATIGDVDTSRDGSSGRSVLMTGDADIHIGGSDTDYPGGLVLKGNVFGSGDYCDIGGTATIEFVKFEQSGSMGSIQKADSVDVVASSLHLKGDMDANTLTGSAKYSLNDLGSFNLKSLGSAHSDVVLDAATSQIRGYSSDTSGDEGLNSITLNRGMTFSIMGKGNNGTNVGSVSGSTMLYSDTSDYYGAMVSAAYTEGNVPNATFMVRVEDEIRAADKDDLAYSEFNVRVWFIQGTMTVEGTVILEDDGTSSNVTEAIDADILKTNNDSQLQYVGYFVNPDSYIGSTPSLVLVNSPDQSTAGRGVQVTIGKNPAGGSGSHITFGTEGLTITDDVSGVNTGTGGPHLNLEFSTASGYNTSGYIGSVTIRLGEVQDGIVFSIHDITVGIYLRVNTTGDEISLEKTILLEGSDDGGYSGQVDVYLPALSNAQVGRYVVTEWPSNVTMEIYNVPSNVSKDGWLNGGWYSVPMTSDSDRTLGTAAVYSPVISIHVDSNSIQDFQMKVVIYAENDVDGKNPLKTITIKITSQEIKTLMIGFYDTELNVLGTGAIADDTWRTPQLVFTIAIDYGSVLSELKLAVSSDCVQGSIISWNCESMESFYQAVSGSLYKEDGNVVTFPESDTSNIGGYMMVGLEEFLEAYWEQKPDTSYEGDAEYIYADNNPALYQKFGSLPEFNMDSIVSGDLSLYFGYSAIVSITVIFGGDSIPESEPEWTLTVDGKEINLSSGIYADGKVVHSFGLHTGSHTFAADFDGYQDAAFEDIDILLTTYKFTIYAVPSTVGSGGDTGFEETHVISSESGHVDGSYGINGSFSGTYDIVLGGSTVHLEFLIVDENSSTLTVTGFPGNYVGTVVLTSGDVSFVFIIVPNTIGSGATEVTPA